MPARGPRPRPDALHVDLAVDTTEEPPAGLSRWLRPKIAAAARHLGHAGGHLSVAVVDDAQMALLHHHHLGDPTTTDVLTFDLRDAAAEGGDAGPLDGELVLCFDEAGRRAAELGHDVKRELLLYAVHGLLHLTGHDDITPDAAAAMHEAEDACLAALGVGPVYRPSQNAKTPRGPRRTPRKAKK